MALRQVYDQCPQYILHNSNSTNHILYNYPDPQSRNVRIEYIKYRNAFQKIKSFAELSTYVWCFLLPELYYRQKRIDNELGWTSYSQECSYPNIILSTFAVALTISTFRTNYTQQLQKENITINSTNIEDEIRYLGETINQASLEVSRLFEFFIDASQLVFDLEKQIRQKIGLGLEKNI